MAEHSAVEAFLHAGRQAGSRWCEERGPWGRALYEFLVFGLKQAWACLFGGLILALLLLSHFYYPEEVPLARYDALVVAVVAIQLLLLVLGLESLAEARVILVFHLVGTAMELFKTQMGSWSYPEASVLRIGEVPLFSGFMYAAVGSYLARVWRLFDFEFNLYPRRRWTLLLALAIYANFFSHHYIWDARLWLFASAALLFGRSWVYFRIDRQHRRMPLLLGFFLVALFIWFAENIATFARAWNYPEQLRGWQPVGVSKLGSWYLLMLISFVLVSLVHRPRRHGPRRDRPKGDAETPRGPHSHAARPSSS